LIQTLFDAGIYKKEFQWINSNIHGAAQAADCVLHQLRRLDGSLEQWTMEKGVPKEFKQWAKAASDGSASENDLVKAVRSLPGGALQIQSFNAGVLVGKKVIDSAGRVLEDTRTVLGGAVDGAAKAGGRLKDWFKKRL
jgi:hypothetical protein